MQNTFSQSGNDSKWFLTKIICQNGYVALETPFETPPPFMANAILNFHFDFLNTSLMTRRASVQNEMKKLIAIFLVLIQIFKLHNARRKYSMTIFLFCTTRSGRLITHGILVEHKTVKHSIPALFILLFVPHPFAFIS